MGGFFESFIPHFSVTRIQRAIYGNTGMLPKESRKALEQSGAHQPAWSLEMAHWITSLPWIWMDRCFLEPAGGKIFGWVKLEQPVKLSSLIVPDQYGIARKDAAL